MRYIYAKPISHEKLSILLRRTILLSIPSLLSAVQTDIG